MKSLLIIITLLSFNTIYSFAQNRPTEVSAQTLQKLKTEVEASVPAFKQGLPNDLNSDAVEFSVDTFRIEQLCAKYLAIDYSTAGMRIATNDLTASYDKLLNKYYQKLSALLKPDDRKILVKTQRTWIEYRDAEEKLIELMTSDRYSSGGTMQLLTATSAYSDIVVQRTIEIFNYYTGVHNKD